MSESTDVGWRSSRRSLLAGAVDGRTPRADHRRRPRAARASRPKAYIRIDPACRSTPGRISGAVGCSRRATGRRSPPRSGSSRRLLLATQRGQRPLTPSGFYYVPLSFGFSSNGPAVFALHVADGSEIITRHVGGPSLSFYVGDGRERYGSCTARLHPARLAEGYLPIVQTSYVDAKGVKYTQESFAGRAYGARSVVSFVQAPHRRASGPLERDRSARALEAARPHGAGRLAYKGNTRLIVSDGAEFVHGVVSVPASRPETRRPSTRSGSTAPPRRRPLHADRRELRRRPSDRRQLLVEPPHLRHALRRARARRRDAALGVLGQVLAVRLALQRRQSVRGALLRRSARRRRGRGAIRVPERREGDPAGLAAAAHERSRKRFTRIPGGPSPLDRGSLLPPDAETGRSSAGRRPSSRGWCAGSEPPGQAADRRAGGCGPSGCHPTSLRRRQRQRSDRRLAGAAGDGSRLGVSRGTAASPRGRACSRSASASALRSALRKASRRLSDGSLFVPDALNVAERRPVRQADQGSRRLVLEPPDAVRARVGLLPGAFARRRTGSSATCWRTARGCSACRVRTRTSSIRTSRTARASARATA